jgi:uncharacterized protein (DUF302 family)
MKEKRLPYGFGREVGIPYGEAVEKARAALKAEGFGVICEIDVQKTIKDKLGVDFRPYIILGACNPPLAHQALETDLDLGLLLPCNVVVYEIEGGAVVEAMDPERVLGLVGNPALEPVARDVRARLERALGRVAGQAT